MGRGSNNEYSVITGGQDNKWDKSDGSVTISGGNANTVAGKNSVVTGGQQNEARGDNSVVFGGRNNKALGPYSFVGGGNGNTALGDHAIAMGQKAEAKNDFSMVINLQGAGNLGDLSSSEDGQFLVRAKQYRFQISTDENLAVNITVDNIQNLQNAIDASPVAVTLCRFVTLYCKD